MPPPRLTAAVVIVSLLWVFCQAETSQQSCSISGLPRSTETYSEAGYPFASSLLHVFEWMKPPCDGRISQIVFGNAATSNRNSLRFYLGVFQMLQLDANSSTSPIYYQLMDYIAINTTTPVEGQALQTYNVPSDVNLRITRRNVLGLFYDKWDTAQDQLVIPYRSITDETARNFKTYVGFMSMTQLNQITQLRLGGELGIKASGRKPALQVTISPAQGQVASDGANHCFAPPVIQNGHVVAAPSTSREPDTYNSGDFALYVCNEGYALGSNVYSSCIDGQWTPIPTCLGSCGSDVPEIPLATVAMKSFSQQSRVGDVIHYMCRTGYMLSMGSQSKVICQQHRNGSYGWSEKPVCVPARLDDLLTTPAPSETNEVICPTPAERIDNGRIDTRSYETQPIPGDSVAYKCNDGYTLIGSEMFCRPDGSWSQMPKCVQPQVTVSARSAGSGSYFVTSTETATLAPGSVTCGDPPKLANARVSRRSYAGRPSTWLDTVIYECIVGFRMKSMSILGCSQNGTWVGFPNLPLCEVAPQYQRENVVSGTCGMAPDVHNARIGVFRVRNSTSLTSTPASATSTSFEFVQYECHPGFRLETKFSVVTCNQGTREWSERPRCIRKQQNDAASTTTLSQDAQEEVDEAAPAAAYAMPPPGAQAMDPRARQAGTMLTGGQITCGEAIEIDNGEILSTTFTNRLSVVGDSVTYNCYQGYTLVGKETIKCDRFAQQWEPEPRCVTSCGYPPVVDGGRIVIKNFHEDQSVVGSTAKYACEIGLTLQSSDTITCLRDGQWNVIPVCQHGGELATMCPAPPVVANATVLSRSYTSNRASWFDTIRYVCDQGFHPINDPIITCNRNGSWSPVPVCMRNPGCNAAPVIQNGYVYSSNFSGNMSEVGSYVRYRCRAGFRLMGLDIAFCNANMQWSTLPTCEILFCPDPPNIARGSQHNRTWPTTRKAQDGDRVAYSCNSGFRIESGTNTIVCLYDGTWTAEPSCVPDVAAQPTSCGLPLRLPYGSIQSASFDYANGRRSAIGDNVVYLCDFAYLLVGPANVRCQENGQWSPLPGCTLGCGTPPVVLNGRVDARNFSETSMPGSYVRYICNSGYELVGDGLMSCGDDGMWYGNIPICASQQLKCNSVPSVRNAKEFSRSFAPGATTAAVGDYVTYICNVGYTMQGRRDVACLNDGSWSTLPTCQGDQPKSCGEPPLITNGVVQSVSYAARSSAQGDTAIYRCTNGFSLTDATATCDRSGRWVDVPTCSSSCGAAPVLANGLISSSSFTGSSSGSGSIVRYSCADGFTLQGPSVVTCQENGRWSTVPSCVTSAAFCSGVPKVLNGHERSRTYATLQALAGDQVTFNCDSGFMMQGSPTVTCLDTGIWSAPPACAVDWSRVQTCGEAPAKIENGRLERTSYVGRKSIPGDAAFYSCDRGYAVFGLNTAYCDKNQQWSILPRCVFTCGPVPTVEKANVVWQNFTSTLPSTVSSAVRYACESGFGIRGNDQIICLASGQWSELPVCASGVVSAPIELAVPIITGQCPPAPSISNGGAVVTTYYGRQPIAGDTATYACGGSYRLVGSETVTCTNDGSWTTLPYCVLGNAQCSTPPRVQNGAEQSRTYLTPMAQPGDRVQYQCLQGFQISGTNTVTCQPDGSWTGVPRCVAVATGPRSCGMAPILANGRIVAQSYQAGEPGVERDTVTYGCLDGFTMTGLNTITCSSVGAWTVLPICRQVQQSCGAAPNLANGRIVRTTFQGSSSRQSDTVTYVCNDGFTLSGTSVITCDPIALQWTVLPVCISVPKTCGSPPTLPNGRLLSQSFARGASSSAGDTLSYDCNTGYALSGSSVVTCDPATSRWTALPICQQSGCGFAPYFANADVVSQNFTGSNSIAGSTVTFQCNIGYSLRSGHDSFVRCQTNGRWTVGPICDATCGSPPLVYNGLVATKTFQTNPKPGDSVTYSCNSGYIMLGTSRSTCMNDGGWSLTPQCTAALITPSYCNEPPMIANGQISSRDYGDDGQPSPGDSVTYACNEGYVISGQTRAYCENATLTFKPVPTCGLLQTCGNNPQLLNGRIVFTSFTNGLQGRPGDTITYACNQGYTLVSGTPTITCDNNLLWGALPICMIMCSQPPNIMNGRIVSTNFSTGNKLLPTSTAQYACSNDTFMMRGSPQITCTSQGRWTTPPLCLSNTCGDAPVVPNARIVASTFTGRPSAQSDMATYACDNGYVLEGNTQVYCDRTLSWSPTPSCRLSCGGPPAGVSANVAWRNFTGNSSIPGSMIRYSCVDSQQMDGFAIQICGDNGRWSPTAPTCGPPPTCGAPPTLENGALVSQSFTRGGNSKAGDVLSFSCNRGYLLVGSPAVHCDPYSMVWSMMPECVVTCYAPPKIPNGIIDWMNFTDTASVVGSTAHYICSSGFGIKGPDMVSCQQNGNWSTVPSCQNLTCGAAPPLQNGKISGTTFASKSSQPGDQVTYDCNQGFSMEGEDTIECDASTQMWSTPPVCNESPTCGAVPRVTNAQIVRTNLVSGTTQRAGFLDSVSFSCNQGYQIQGPAQVVCAGDPLAWSDLPTCLFVEPSCPDASTIQNGYIHSINYADNSRPRRGDTIAYGCNPGYVITGSASITCDGSPLRWSRAPACVVSCGFPPAVMYANVTRLDFQNDQSVTGSTVRYTCTGGTFLTQGQAQVQCNNGKWGTLPKCEVRTCGDPPLIQNGIVNSTTFTGQSSPGDRATYQCGQSYRMSGNATATCDRTTLRWLGVPSCSIKPSCGDPPVVIHGDILTTSYYPATRSVIGDTVTYACDRGYQMVGQPIGTCDQRTLLWINVPTCQYAVSCGPPPIITGARVAWSNVSAEEDAAPNTAVRYECNSGLILQGSSTITCGSDGQWSLVPSCSSPPQPICPNPPAIENAREVSRSFAGGANGRIQVGDFVVYECLQGFQLVGRNRAVCLSTGDWAVQILCQGSAPSRTLNRPVETCGAPPVIQNGQVSSGAASQQSVQGDAVYYQCNRGYALARGQGMITCDRIGNVLRWTPAPFCVQSCGPAPIVEGSVIVFSNFSNDQSVTYSVVHYQCQNEFDMRGSDKAYCQSNGEWTQTPVCASQQVSFCFSEPPQLPNGFEVMRTFGGRTAKQGDFVSISCNTGYQRFGDDVIVCLPTGQWSSAPRCLQTDNRGQPISNNIFEISCGAAPTIQGAYISWRQNSAQGSRNSQPGDWVEYTCTDPNSDISGLKRVTCQSDGTWSSLPSCTSRLIVRAVSCGDAPVISNAVVVDKTFASSNAIANDRVTYRCSTGFIMAGGPEIRCTLSGWSILPRCLRSNFGSDSSTVVSCGAAPDVPNAVIQQADFLNANSRSGSRVVYRCLDGYMFSSTSSSTATCRNTGIWTVAPSCVAISRNSLATEGCPTPPTVEHASIVFRSYQGPETTAVPYSSIVMYTCENGYRFTTRSNFVQCTVYGNWSDAPVCAPTKQCGIPPMVDNARVVKRTFDGAVARATDLVFYACLPGYELASSVYSIECTNSGNWTTMPRCNKKSVTCGSIPRVNQARLVYKSFQAQASVGDVAWFSCVIGYRLRSGSEVVNCQEDGQWSEIPVCEASSGNCEDPPRVQGATIYYQSYPVTTRPGPGDYVRYKCGVGLRIQGDHDEVTCTVAGTWTDRPNCLEVLLDSQSPHGASHHCSFPPVVRNGRITMATFDREQNQPKAGDYVMYSCDAGFVLDSSDSSSTCTVNGTWTKAPRCQKAASTCGNPPLVQQGYISQPYKTPTLPGTEVHFACSNGFRLVGVSKITCLLSGKWSTGPVCEATHEAPGCGYIPDVDHSVVLEQNFVGSSSRIGSYATLSCEQPFILQGNSRIECLQTSEWSDLPTCIARDTTGPRCGQLPSVDSASISFTTVPEGEEGIVGDLIWFQCDAGLQPNAYPGVRCMSTGEWSALPRCIIGESPVCPPGINLIFVFDLNEVEGFSRETDLLNLATFLDTFPVRWQSLVQEMSSNGTARVTKNTKLGLGGVTMTGMAKRDYVWTAMNVSSLERYDGFAWRSWLQKNLAQFKHAFKDDLTKLFRTARNTVLPKLPFTNNNRIIYMTTTRRGGSLLEARTELEALKAEPWNGRVFTLALGPALSGQAQQTLLREEIASDSSYFKFVAGTDDLHVESLAHDKSFAEFLCSSS